MTTPALLVLAVLSQVEVRGPGRTPAGEAVRLSADGVVIATTAAEGRPSHQVELGWDQVRAVSGKLADQAKLYEPIAAKAWRARTRLERGDIPGAEPLLDELFTVYARRTGPTAAVVAQGVTLCRLARGAQASAVAPWLAWLRCGPAALNSVTTIAADEGAGIALNPDPATGLVPNLPPMWLDVPGTQALARSERIIEPLDQDAASNSAVARADVLALYYLAAAKSECGLLRADLPASTDDPAVKLVSEIVSSRLGDKDTRAASRASLRARLKSRPAPWAEAWIRAALGRSLLREDTADDKRLGVVELLHVPARFSDEAPALTGLCLAEAAVALHSLGDDLGAERLRHDLQTEYPGHPALDWPPLRAWKAPPPVKPLTKPDAKSESKPNP